MAVSRTDVNENEELCAKKARIEQEAAMSAESSAKPEIEVRFLERETEVLNCLIEMLPFDD
jgi:hypothetical protein